MYILYNRIVLRRKLIFPPLSREKYRIFAQFGTKTIHTTFLIIFRTKVLSNSHSFTLSRKYFRAIIFIGRIFFASNTSRIDLY